MSVEMEMPKYKCHKVVHALQIGLMMMCDQDGRHTDDANYVQITPIDERYAPFNVSREFFLKHDPSPNGYIVYYAGGYVSYSPQKEFEEGYTLISDDYKARVRTEHAELLEKTNALMKFIDGDVFKALKSPEQRVMTNQLSAMHMYLIALHDRIENFK